VLQTPILLYLCSVIWWFLLHS